MARISFPSWNCVSPLASSHRRFGSGAAQFGDLNILNLKEHALGMVLHKV